MSYEIFTVGNEAISTKFVDDIINQTTNKIYVVSSQYYGKELAYDFTLASLFLVNNQTIIDQCICVKSQAALNTIDAFCEDKIVLVNFNCLDFRFTKSLRNTYIFFDTYFTTDIALKIPYRQDFVKQVEKFFTDSNWQRIEAIENKAVEIINKADDYTTIKHAVENAAIEINEVETVTATAVEYSLQDAVDSELIAYDTLLKMADINNHFGPYNESDLKPKYTDAIKEAYGKAENLAKDEIYIEYFGEYPVSGSDNSFLACIVFPDSQGSAPERYAVEIGGVEFWFLPGCEITIWCIELDE